MNRRIKVAIAAIIVLGVLSLILLISLVHHFQLRAAENAFRARLKATGILAELSQARAPAPSPGQDGTAIFLQAATWMSADKTCLSTDSIYAMRPVASGKAMVASRQPVVHWDETTNSWAALAAALNQNQPALDRLCQLIDHPALDFHFRYSDGLAGLEFTNLNLPELKKSARYLSEAAIADLHRGDVAASVTNARAILVLADAMRGQRLLISELVRMTMVNMAQGLTWEILQSPNVTGEQLAALQDEWQQVNFVKSFQDALLMEQAAGEITLAKWRASDAELEKYFAIEDQARESMGYRPAESTTMRRIKNTFNVFWWRYWWSYTDELRSLKGYEVVAETLRAAETNDNLLMVYQEQQRKLDVLGLTQLGDEFDNFRAGKPRDMRHMLSESIATLAASFHKVMLYETADRVLLTAIALKQFELKHGNYPEKLSELEPEFLARVPLDPMAGKPLHYHRDENGAYLLYSVGENGADDAGNPGPPTESPAYTSYYWQNQKAADWVWPQPATAAEVEKYYADEAAKLK